MSTFSNQTLILDLGSYKCKAGFACHDSPSRKFQPVINRINIGPTLYKGIGFDFFQEQIGHRYYNPLEHGCIEKWDEFEFLLDSILKVTFNNVKDHPMILTDLQPFAHCKTNIISILFDSYEISDLYIGNSAVFTALAHNSQTCAVIDIGRQTSKITPVIDGWAIKTEVKELGLSGNDVSEYFHQYLHLNGADNQTYSKRNNAYQTINSIARISKDYENETFWLCQQKRNDLYQEIHFPELLFNPSIIHRKTQGIHVSIDEAVRYYTHKFGFDFWSKIILSGGTTTFPGFHSRLKKELTYGLGVQECIPDSAWKGAAKFASLDTFPHFLVSRDEYNEEGPWCLHRKWL